MIFTFIKRKLIIFVTIGLLVSCSTTRELEYLDDNLSDRMALAQDILGSEVKYFDTSKYGKLAIARDGTIVEIGLQEMQNGGVADLIELIDYSIDNRKKIAVSGRDSEHSAKLLIDAINSIDVKADQELTILYIGERAYYSSIKLQADLRNINLVFARIPVTKAYPETLSM